MTMTLRVFGIRHHGPGSARSLRAALADFRPDAVLVEGPSDATGLLELAADPDMRPPVALLAYAKAEPARSIFWPLASFSPEWQALQWALAARVPVRLVDLPAAHLLARSRPKDADGPSPADAPSDPEDAEKAPPGPQETPPGSEGTSRRAAGTSTDPAEVPADLPGIPVDPGSEPFEPGADPLDSLARAGGYDDTERWWEDLVEHDLDAAGPFAAIAEAMAALRAEAPSQ